MHNPLMESSRNFKLGEYRV